MTGRALVLRGDARALPLPDASVDLIVTSPPYYALRSYSDGGEHYEGQIGSEATPAEYIDNLIECTAEWVRVLKPSGSLWVNLGDVYYSGKGSPGRTTVDAKSPARTARRANRSPLDYGLDFPRKTLLGLPWRYALGCIDQLGLILRAEVVWSKVNGLPESVTDRVRRSHEQWFHMVRQPRYFAAVDEIRDEYSPNKPWGSGARSRESLERALAGVRRNPCQQQTGIGTEKARTENPLGKLPGSVWEIATEPLRVPEHLGIDHFAAYPLAFPLRIITGWSPPGICVECGEGLRPVVHRLQRTYHGAGGYRSGAQQLKDGAAEVGWAMDEKWSTSALIAGYACECTPYTDHPGTGSTTRRSYSPGVRGNNAQGTYGRHQAGEYQRVGPWREYHLHGWEAPPTRPAVVLDPFAGTGTTMLAAKALGRIGVGVDRSADYCRLAQWRTTDLGELAKAMRVEKPPPQLDGQEPLFDVAEVSS